MRMITGEEWWTVRQAAEVACMEEPTLRKWIRTGRLARGGVAARKPGKLWQINADEFVSFLLHSVRD